MKKQQRSPPENTAAVERRHLSLDSPALARDVEPSQHIARKDAERQMVEHCGRGGYEIVSMDQYDTGNSVSVSQGYGVATQKRILVKQFNYACK